MLHTQQCRETTKKAHWCRCICFSSFFRFSPTFCFLLLCFVIFSVNAEPQQHRQRRRRRRWWLHTERTFLFIIFFFVSFFRSLVAIAIIIIATIIVWLILCYSARAAGICWCVFSKLMALRKRKYPTLKVYKLQTIKRHNDHTQTSRRKKRQRWLKTHFRIAHCISIHVNALEQTKNRTK